jgi:hypothetical protein
MIVWLIERGWVRLVLLVLMGAMVLAAMTYDPPRPSEPPCLPATWPGLGTSAHAPKPRPAKEVRPERPEPATNEGGRWPSTCMRSATGS